MYFLKNFDLLRSVVSNFRCWYTNFIINIFVTEYVMHKFEDKFAEKKDLERLINKKFQDKFKNKSDYERKKEDGK
jgi:hypothetical protein